MLVSMRAGLCWVGLSAVLLFLPAAQAAAPIEADTYPRTVRSAAGEVHIHHPEISDWKDFQTVLGRSVLEVKPAGQEHSLVATARFQVDTVVDLDSRVVKLLRPKVQQLKFDQSEATPAARQLALDALASGSDTVALDFLLHSLPADFALPADAHPPAQLKFDPPRIVISETPQRLMLVDGPPSYVAIDGIELEFIVNTNWTVFRHPTSQQWFILDGQPEQGHWLRNSLFASGDWIRTTELPADFQTLSLNSNWPQVGQAMPPQAASQQPDPIVISYEPTELVISEGPFEWDAIQATGLRFVSNSASDLFELAGNYYLLVGGRWYQTRDLDHQWHSVAQLPADFSAIPADHPRGHVLASVPGTTANRLARIEAAIPRVATVKLSSANDLEVPYAGEPSFVEIQGTALRRAENTPFQVISNNNFYYLCHQGAWYASSAPRGPWQAATEVPEAIYTIPPSDPAYNVTFVKVKAFDDSSNEVAYYSTSGYYHKYWGGSSLVWGTGWYHPGYYRGGAYWRYPGAWGYHGAWRGAWSPYGYYGWQPNYSITLDSTPREKDWQWDLDGNKRTVYDYGPRNHIGGGRYQQGNSRMFDAPKSSAGSHQKANAGDDELYSGDDGGVYRRQDQQWQRWTRSGWVTLSNQQAEQMAGELERMHGIRDSAYRDYDRYREQ